MLDSTMNFSEFLPKDATITKTPDAIKLSWQAHQGESPADLLKRYDELITISRDCEAAQHTIEVLDPVLRAEDYTPEEVKVLCQAEEIIRTAQKRKTSKPEESLH